MPSKYAKLQLRAAALITKKGTRVTWVKTGNTDPSDDSTPWFPTDDNAVETPDVAIVFYTEDRQELFTIAALTPAGQPTNQKFAVIPGNVGFIPEKGDLVRYQDGPLTGQLITVDTVQTTDPDGYPVIYQVGFK